SGRWGTSRVYGSITAAELAMLCAVAAGVDPPYLYPAYRSTVSRAPQQRLRPLPPELAGLPGPRFEAVPAAAADLTGRRPLGERIIVTGRVLDDGGAPVAGALVEIWQANAAGRYDHPEDDHPAPP